MVKLRNNYIKKAKHNILFKTCRDRCTLALFHTYAKLRKHVYDTSRDFILDTILQAKVIHNSCSVSCPSNVSFDKLAPDQVKTIGLFIDDQRSSFLRLFKVVNILTTLPYKMMGRMRSILLLLKTKP